jgi:hypothetical protein
MFDRIKRNGYIWTGGFDGWWGVLLFCFLTLVGFSHSLCDGQKLEKTKKVDQNGFFYDKTHFPTIKLIFPR